MTVNFNFAEMAENVPVVQESESIFIDCHCHLADKEFDTVSSSLLYFFITKTHP